MTNILRNITAGNSELLQDWEGVGSSQHRFPGLSTMTRDKLLGTEPAPTTEVLKYKDKQKAKKENNTMKYRHQTQ